MKITRQNIVQILDECIDELNEQLNKEQRLSKTPETPLLGNGGGLDSLGFVNLVALVEEKCQERFGRSLVLAESDAKQGTRNPFDTVGTLAEYIEHVLAGNPGAWH